MISLETGESEMGADENGYGTPSWEFETGIKRHLVHYVTAGLCAAIYAIERADGDRKGLQELFEF
jgi:hypothetical protein